MFSFTQNIIKGGKPLILITNKNINKKLTKNTPELLSLVLNKIKTILKE